MSVFKCPVSHLTRRRVLLYLDFIFEMLKFECQAGSTGADLTAHGIFYGPHSLSAACYWRRTVNHNSSSDSETFQQPVSCRTRQNFTKPFEYIVLWSFEWCCKTPSILRVGFLPWIFILLCSVCRIFLYFKSMGIRVILLSQNLFALKKKTFLSRTLQNT